MADWVERRPGPAWLSYALAVLVLAAGEGAGLGARLHPGLMAAIPVQLVVWAVRAFLQRSMSGRIAPEGERPKARPRLPLLAVLLSGH
jgi:hypothetical protein